MKIGIYQVCFSPESDKIDPEFIRYYNHRRDQLFENAVILDIYNSKRYTLFDYIGVLSWRFGEKTGKTGREVIDAISDEPSYDVYNLLPRSCCYDKEHPYNRPGFMPAVDLARMIDNRNILPFKLWHYDTQGLAVWCNYFVCKKEVFALYCEKYLLSLVSYFANPDEEVKQFISKPLSEFNFNRRHRDGIEYTVVPFFLEGLFSVFCHREGLKVKTL